MKRSRESSEMAQSISVGGVRNCRADRLRQGPTADRYRYPLAFDNGVKIAIFHEESGAVFQIRNRQPEQSWAKRAYRPCQARQRSVRPQVDSFPAGIQ